MKFKKKAVKEAEPVLTLQEDIAAILEQLQLGEYSSKAAHQRTVWGYDLAAQDIEAVFTKHGYKKAPEGASMALDDLLDDLSD